MKNILQKIQWTFLLPLISVLFFATSCVDFLTDDFPNRKSEIVVNGILIAEQTISIHISESDGLSETSIENISDARVELFEDDVSVGLLVHEGGGFYRSEIVARPGRKYYFNILVDTYELVEVEDIVPLTIDTVSVEHIDVYGINNEGVLYPALNLKIPNNLVDDQYFEVIVYLKSEDGTEMPAMWERFEDTLITREGLPIGVFSNKDVQNDRINLTLPYYSSRIVGGTRTPARFFLYPFTVHIRSVSYQYFQFAKIRYLYDLSRYPSVVIGAPTSINLHSNVKNGLGFVGGMSIYRTEEIIPE